MCKAILKNMDEDKRLAGKKTLRLITDMIGWVPTFMQGVVGAISDLV